MERVGWPGPWPSTVPITWANLGVGDEDLLRAGCGSRDHISIFAKLCWFLRKHGRRGEDDQGNHSYHSEHSEHISKTYFFHKKKIMAVILGEKSYLVAMENLKWAI